MEGLYPQLPQKQVNQMNMLALAHVGDAVYELLVRSMLCSEKNAPVMQLHRLTVKKVCAEAQAADGGNRLRMVEYASYLHGVGIDARIFHDDECILYRGQVGNRPVGTELRRLGL